MSRAAPNDILDRVHNSRLRAWANGNGLTLLCIAFFNTCGIAATVIACH